MKKEETKKMQELERQFHVVDDLFNKAVQLWKKMEEDQQV
jgi:hypothetical protein